MQSGIFIFLVVSEWYFHFFGGIRTGIEKIGSGKVPEPVSEKFYTGKKSQNQYGKNWVPEKKFGTGIGKIWYRLRFWSPKFWNFEDL